MATTTPQPESCCTPCASPTGAPPKPIVDVEDFGKKAWLFASGTLTGAIDGISAGGRWGFYAGVALSVVYWAMSALNPAVLVCTIASTMLLGCMAGGIAGLIGGGIDRVEKGERPKRARAQREILGAKSVGILQDEHEVQDDKQFERQLQQERENTQDMNNYWQEKMMHVGHDHSPAGGK